MDKPNPLKINQINRYEVTHTSVTSFLFGNFILKASVWASYHLTTKPDGLRVLHSTVRSRPWPLSCPRYFLVSMHFWTRNWSRCFASTAPSMQRSLLLKSLPSFSFSGGGHHQKLHGGLDNSKSEP